MGLGIVTVLLCITFHSQGNYSVSSVSLYMYIILQHLMHCPKQIEITDKYRILRLKYLYI